MRDRLPGLLGSVAALGTGAKMLLAMSSFTVQTDYLLRVLTDLINTPSPTGDTDWIIGFVEQELESLGIPYVRTHKGACVAQLEGLRSDLARGVSAHVDTLGAVVAEIKSNGRLRLASVGGLMWPSVESEGVMIATRGGRQIRGSVVLENGAAHVNKEAHTNKRDADSLEVRLDERTSSIEETKLLGIDVGDFVYIDPRLETSEAGFVRSRFLDDKACVACLLGALKALRDAGVSAAQTTTCLFSNFEEVGHGGMDGLPAELAELVVLDMACVGKGLQGDELHCTICVKDAGGPYSRRLTEKLRNLAERAEIDLKTDVYPFYSSDGTAYWRSGGRAEVALIGPGVDTSHGYERTHIDALIDTTTLLAEYLVEN